MPAGSGAPRARGPRTNVRSTASYRCIHRFLAGDIVLLAARVAPPPPIDHMAGKAATADFISAVTVPYRTAENSTRVQVSLITQ